jgi:hypothetical protein
MNNEPNCPQCGASLPAGSACQDYFYQMLYWENEHPPMGEVHHLTVLCYYLQHPGLYSPQGLLDAQALLAGFLEDGLTPEAARRINRSKVDSAKRDDKIKAARAASGSYSFPIAWKMTARDVVFAGHEQYIANVRAWARSLLVDLRSSGNFERPAPGGKR